MVRYTIDTNAVISYYINEFDGGRYQLSKKTHQLIDNAFNDNSIIIYFPSIIFLEIFSKWFKDEESSHRIRSNVYIPIISQANFAVEPLDQEVLENFLRIKNIEEGWNFDNHDKQILATAMKFKTPLISSDERIIRFNRKQKVIPYIIS